MRIGCKIFAIKCCAGNGAENVGMRVYRLEQLVAINSGTIQWGERMPAPHVLMSPDRPAVDGLPGGAAESDDLTGLRLVTVPDWGLPFDDEVRAGATAGKSRAGTAQPCTAQPLTAVPPPFAGALREVRSQRQDRSGEWSRQFAGLVAEALAGARPARHIHPWTSERARVQLHKLMPLFGGGQRPRVLRVMTARPTIDVIEMTVIVGIRGRTRALAIRLEQAGPRPLPRPDGHAAIGGPAGTPRWVCTDIEAA